MEGGSRYPSRATPTAIRLPLKIRMARRTPTLRRRLRSPPPRIPPLPRHQRARHRPHARRQFQYRHRHPLAPHQLHPPRPLLPLLPQSPRKRPKHGSRHPHENPGERTTRTAPKHAEPVLLPSIGASRVIALNSIATTTASPASDSAYRLRRFRSHGRRPTVTALPSLTAKPAPPLHRIGITELKPVSPLLHVRKLIWALSTERRRPRFHSDPGAPQHGTREPTRTRAAREPPAMNVGHSRMTRLMATRESPAIHSCALCMCLSTPRPAGTCGDRIAAPARTGGRNHNSRRTVWVWKI